MADLVPDYSLDGDKEFLARTSAALAKLTNPNAQGDAPPSPEPDFSLAGDREFLARTLGQTAPATPTAAPPTSTGAFLRGAVRGIVPSLGAMAGAGFGAEVGGVLGGGTPAEVVTVPVGALGGAFLGAEGVGKLQEKALNLLPDWLRNSLGQGQQQQQSDLTEHPIASFLGEFVPNAAMLRPGRISAAPEAASALQKLMSKSVVARGIGAGVAAAQQYAGNEMTGQPTDPKDIAIAAALGALLNKETKLGAKVSGAGARLVRAPVEALTRGAAPMPDQTTVPPPPVAEKLDKGPQIVSSGTPNSVNVSQDVSQNVSQFGAPDADALRALPEGEPNPAQRILQSLPRGPDAGIPQNAPGEPGAEAQGQGAVLRGGIQTPGQAGAEAVLGLRGSEEQYAPLGLQPAAASDLAVPDLPLGPPQAGEGGQAQSGAGQVRGLVPSQDQGAAGPAAGQHVPPPGAPTDQVGQQEQTGTAPNGNGTRAAPLKITAPGHVELASENVNTAPSEAQKRAGNYQKGHVQLHGLDISIENPKGSERSGVDADGNPWTVQMPSAYGYIKRTMGADGDQVDTYIGDHPDSDRVFVVDQKDAETGRFDENKAFLGFRSEPEVRDTYLKAFSDNRGAERIGGLREMSIDDFKQQLNKGAFSKAPKGFKTTPAQIANEHALETARTGTDAANAVAAKLPPTEPEKIAAYKARDERIGENWAKQSQVKFGRAPTQQAVQTATLSIAQALDKGVYSEHFRPNNTVSRAIFEQETGTKLPKTIQGTKEFLHGQSWLAPTKENAAPASTSGAEVDQQGAVQVPPASSAVLAPAASAPLAEAQAPITVQSEIGSKAGPKINAPDISPSEKSPPPPISADQARSALKSNIDPRTGKRPVGNAALKDMRGTMKLIVQNEKGPLTAKPLPSRAAVGNEGSFLSTVQSLGGIRTKDSAGNLTKEGQDVREALKDYRRPGLINDSSGRNPDDMRSWFEENGWFAGSHDNGQGMDNLYEALRSEANGSKVYHPSKELVNDAPYDESAHEHFLDGRAHALGITRDPNWSTSDYAAAVTEREAMMNEHELSPDIIDDHERQIQKQFDALRDSIDPLDRWAVRHDIARTTRATGPGQELQAPRPAPASGESTGTAAGPSPQTERAPPPANQRGENAPAQTPFATEAGAVDAQNKPLPQTVIPGAERISESANLKRKSETPLRGAPGQKSTEGLGLFSPEAALKAKEEEPGLFGAGVEQPAAWHGSPYEFDKFSSDKIGTGEGAQVYGHGLYFAGKKGVAEHYRETLSRRGGDSAPYLQSFDKPGSEVTTYRFGTPEWEAASIIENKAASSSFRGPARFDQGLDTAKTDVRKARAGFGIWGDKDKAWIDRFEGVIKRAEKGETLARGKAGSLYQVELAPKDDEWLDWDKPLSQQSDKVKAAIEQFIGDKRTEVQAPGGRTVNMYRLKSNFGGSITNASGADLYRHLTAGIYADGKAETLAGAARLASDTLHKAGIPGIRYADAGSRDIAKRVADAKAEIQQVKKNIETLKRGIDAVESGRLGETNKARGTAKDREYLKHTEDRLAELERDARGEQTHNYVVFDDKHVSITGVEQGKGEKKNVAVARSVRNEVPAAFENSKTHGEALRSISDLLVKRGEKTGHETASLYNPETGDLSHLITSDDSSAVRFSDEVQAAVRNPDNRFVLQHNHPMNGSLSGGDITALANPGVEWIVAHSKDGSAYAARLTPDIAQASNIGEGAASGTKRSAAVMGMQLRHVTDEARRLTALSMFQAIRDGKIGADEAVDSFYHAMSVALQKAGVIDYRSTKPVTPIINRVAEESRHGIVEALRRVNLAPAHALRPTTTAVQRSGSKSAGELLDEIGGHAERPSSASRDRTDEGGARPVGEGQGPDTIAQGERPPLDEIKESNEPLGGGIASHAEAGKVSPGDGGSFDNISDAISSEIKGKGPSTQARDLFRIYPAGITKTKFLNVAETQGLLPRTLSAQDTRFSKLWNAVRLKDDKRNSTAADLRGDIKSYLDLNPAERKKLYAYEELRMMHQGIVSDAIDEKTFSAENKGIAGIGALLDQAAYSKPGDKIVLDTPQLKEAEQERRAMFDRAWTEVIKSSAKKLGWHGEADSAVMLKKAESMAHGADRTRTIRNASLISMMESQRQDAYIPRMRFGDYYLAIRPKSGTEKDSLGGYPSLTRFELVESRNTLDRIMGQGPQPGQLPKNAAQRIAELRKQFPESKYDIEHGYMFNKGDSLKKLDIPAIEKFLALVGNDVQGKVEETLPADMSPAEKAKTAQSLFDDLVDKVRDQMYQEMKAGFKKRAKTVPGYEGDFDRTTGAYINWISGHVAHLEHGDAIQQAKVDYVDAHPDPEVRKYADHWLRSLNERPSALDAGARAARQAAFLYTLAGNAASTAKILLHAPMLGGPLLGAATGHGKAMGALLNAMRESATQIRIDRKEGLTIAVENLGHNAEEKTLLKDLSAKGSLHQSGAEEIAAMSRHGEAAQAGPQKFWRRAMTILSSNIAAADIANRASMALAAFRLAKNPAIMAKIEKVWGGNESFKRMVESEGLTPSTFARFMVDQANGIWGSRGRMPVARNWLGSTAVQFKNFEVNYLSNMNMLMRRMGPEGKLAATMMLGGLGALGGVAALPFSQDIEGAAQWMYGMVTGINPDLDADLAQFAEDEGLSKASAEMVLHGPSRALGLDLGSLGFGDVIGQNTMSPLDVFPSVSIFAGAAQRAYQRYQSGQEPSAVVAEGLPNAVKNVVLGLDVYPKQGIETPAGNQILTANQISSGMGAMKALGFTSSDVSRAYEERNRQFDLTSASKGATSALEQKAANLTVRAMHARAIGDEAGAASIEAERRQAILDGVHKGAISNIRSFSVSVMQHVIQHTAPEASAIKKAPRALRGEVATSPLMTPSISSTPATKPTNGKSAALPDLQPFYAAIQSKDPAKLADLSKSGMSWSRQQAVLGAKRAGLPATANLLAEAAFPVRPEIARLA